MSRERDTDTDIEDLEHFGRKEEAGDGGGDVEVLNEGVRVPTHVLRKLIVNDVPETEIMPRIERLQQRLTEYLDPDETLQAVYRGVGASFNGAGGGLYVFGATDRRFVLLDNEGHFEEVQYDSVTEIDGEKHSGSLPDISIYDPPNWRQRMAIAAVVVVGVGLWGRFINSNPLVGLLGIVAFFALWYYPLTLVLTRVIDRGKAWWFKTSPIKSHWRKIIIRTPTSTETSTTVDTHIDHYMETADVTVSKSSSERYVLRQWLTPEEVVSNPDKLSDPRKLNDDETLVQASLLGRKNLSEGALIHELEGEPKSSYFETVKILGDATAGEPDLRRVLSKFVRDHR